MHPRLNIELNPADNTQVAMNNHPSQRATCESTGPYLHIYPHLSLLFLMLCLCHPLWCETTCQIHLGAHSGTLPYAEDDEH
jgi:hypothetical protein